MDKISRKIYQHIKELLTENDELSEPILYTLGVKIASGSLGTHGVDCYKLGQFTELSKDKLIDSASATELAWTIILMYDDILDNDRVRYGEPTAWVTYGKVRTEKAIHYGLQLARATHPFKSAFDDMYAECLSAMENVKYLPLNAGSRMVEKAYHGYTFGCYDYLLPFDDVTKKTLSFIGYKKMLMAQLINDYKDTCGSRRQSRNYPELRENQANYVTSLYVDTLGDDAQADFAKLIRDSNNSEAYEKIVMTLTQNNTNILKKMHELSNEINSEVLHIPHDALRAYLMNLTEQISDSFKSMIQAEILT